MSRKLRDEAAAWHVRLSSDQATEADYLAFESWVSDPANRAAYDGQDRLGRDIADNAGAFRQVFAMARSDQRIVFPALLRRTWSVGALAFAAVALFALFLLPRSEPDRWTIYSAPGSEARLISLRDGSSIHLNRGSTVRVAMSGRSRRIQLSEGEAFFRVMHDSKHPFSDEVGVDRIEDVGTEFNVLNADNLMVVTVGSGSVAVLPRASGADGAGVTLGAGDQFLRRGSGSPVVVRGVNTAAAFSWRSGHLVYNDASLTEVVTDLNRYFARDVRIVGADAAALRFSGVIAIDSEDRVLERLKSLLPIDVSESGEEVVVRHDRK